MRSEQDSAAGSVIIPAHNEGAVLGRCLRAITTGLSDLSLDVVVVANGCSDDTADVARGFGVRVIEIAEASKSAALDAGDEASSAFPRFYVDADIEVKGDALLRVASALRKGPELVAAPALRLDLTGVSRPVRSYLRVWCRLPYVSDRHVGSGVLGMSEAGRRRFDRWPSLTADDYFVHRLYQPSERLTVADAEFVVRPARVLSEMVRRKVRVYSANTEMLRSGLVPAEGVTRGGWRQAVRQDPKLATALPAYLTISLAADVLARRKVRWGDMRTWERDQSSRQPLPATKA